MKNSEYVCGIPVTDNYNLTRHKIYMRVRFHPKSSGHILACGEHDAINITPTEEEKMINYIEKPLKQRFGWVQLSEGKIFCKVRNMLML